ncbi:16S rRNA processing protein RimM [Desulfobulbus propionicus DSM 2032]|uniref:Ribosome maturation factor RimM n=1 Tax=Desulfobulbus propionicus (strain ATCC 33891 / DSM 2032 / VKM B-1956 / 1pr3) TaxID=577650 RepID=A0A7U3YNA5_DESPD|nr:ribosome maturation factor RimM [Desulfobulbus propionicus]ADW18529.1 16S rRNA processing protein RimM [Desulfobulbus propionicus DSM 2032]
MASTGSGTGDDFVALGLITRPHGIRGELKIRSFTEKPENLNRYRRLFLASDVSSAKLEFTNVLARVNGSSVILRLKECTDRDRAEELVGMLIWVPSKDLPPTAAGEFYLHSLQGKQARTTDGQELGTVETFLAGGGQNILVIRQGGEEYLVPVVGAFIVSITENMVILDLPLGLLDINRA